jgi:octaprenyl-diphosphate synthase
MTEGELIQLTVLGKLDITEEEYFDILKRKTAYLFSACCELGGLLGEVGVAGQTALREYGLNLGVAFQLADDALDLTGDESLLGKAAGADLIEGKMTLPLILLMREDPSIRDLMTQIIRDGDYRNNAQATLAEKLDSFGIIAKVRRLAYDFAESARKNLDVLPETAYRSALEVIPEYVIERSK